MSCSSTDLQEAHHFLSHSFTLHGQKISTVCFYLLQDFYYYIYCTVLFRTLSIVSLYLPLIPLLLISAFQSEQWNLNSVFLLLKSLRSVCLSDNQGTLDHKRKVTPFYFLYSGMFRPFLGHSFLCYFLSFPEKCVVLHIRNLLFLNLIVSYYHLLLVSVLIISIGNMSLFFFSFNQALLPIYPCGKVAQQAILLTQGWPSMLFFQQY